VYLPADYPIAVEALLEQYHSSVNSLNKCVSWQGDKISLLPGVNACNTLATGQLARVESGLIYVNWGAKTVFILQPGDFIFHFNSFEGLHLSYMAEEPSSLRYITTNTLLGLFTANKQTLYYWHNLLLIQSTIFASAYGASIKQGTRPTAGFQRYTAGETIIQEGESAEHVYTLLKGDAVASVKCKQVGKIKEGEIFGALAAITGNIRNASVLAHSNCTVMAVPKEQFIDLIRSQPETCLQMITTMAQQITELNSRASEQVESAL
jgi:CRP/FNR family transcriptional regulator, cyclic AMP receptor protein